eukprot:2685357-Pyramimonas_sp.AAC.1
MFVMRQAVKDAMPCSVHNDCCCILESATLHVAGTECIDWSPLGSHGGAGGKSALPFFVWIGQRR